jgi:hypothetical protein
MGHMHAPLQLGERGPTRRVQGDDLPVQNRMPPSEQGGQFGSSG